MNGILIVSGVVMALGWGLITWLSIGIPLQICRFIDHVTGHLFSSEVVRMANGFHYDVNNSDMPTVIFLIVFYIIFAIAFFLIGILEKRQSTRDTLKIVVLFSLLFRLIALPGVLIHENDIYRYLWDGKTMNNGINPFKYAPGDLWMYEYNITEDTYDKSTDAHYRVREFSKHDEANLQTLIQLRDQNPVYFDRIGYKEVATIYPPVAQRVFTTTTMLAQDSIGFMKFIFVLFDVGVIILIIGLLKYFRIDPAYVLIYGWSPLVVLEFANMGHYDPIVIFFTLLSLYLLLIQKPLLSSASLALATLSKFFSVLLLPFFAHKFRRHEFFLFGAVIAVLYAPYIFLDQAGVAQLFSGLGDYNREWAYNSGIYSLVYVLMDAVNPVWTDSLLPSKIVVGVLYLMVLVGLFIKRRKDDLSIVHQCFVAVAALFILNPVGDPWYFCWVVPFLCIFRYRSWILLSGLLVFSYINFRGDIALTHQRWLGIAAVIWVIYVPFFVYLLFEFFKKPKYLSFKESNI